MKNKILKSFVAILVLIPCMFLFTACGSLKALEDKTLVFAKVEVTGSLDANEVESEYSTYTFKFDDDTVIFYDGTNEYTYDYKLEDGKLYLKDANETEYDEVFGKISGKYLVKSVEYDGGTATVYFKSK